MRRNRLLRTPVGSRLQAELSAGMWSPDSFGTGTRLLLPPSSRVGAGLPGNQCLG